MLIIRHVSNEYVVVENEHDEQVCPVCGLIDGPFTKDHEPPQWYEVMLTPLRGPGVRWNENGVPMGDGAYRLSAAHEIGICQPCHHWFNITFEQPETRLLITELVTASRTRRWLTPDEQRAVALWLMKTVWMQFIAWDRLTTVGALQSLRNTGELSARAGVWIGQASERVVKGAAPQNLVPKPELVGCFAVPWSTWAVPVRFYRLSCLLIDNHPALDWPIELPVELRSRFTRIWPPHENVIEWRPEMVIDRPTDDAFTSVFGPGDAWTFNDEPENPA